ncbi:Phosphate:acyl-ACP acyltransferase PlsX (EC 2.3.1.n2) [hydrothermal vent metagenome]|uniref:phosphate acyltransferase n=1 Tax=hydrothermal vent metagenome TaxID=652676 RepID=A0A3B1B0E9_9ZZZZ
MTNNSIIISLDAMGGDFGPTVIIPAAIKALKKHPALTLILVGDEDKLVQTLKKHGRSKSDRLQIQHASQVVLSDEPPAQALRGKKNSSMRVAINLVKEGRAQANVSAGNTGALMATARFVLKTLPGIDRPAICTMLPNMHDGHAHVLDLGANVDSSAQALFEFAVMGAALATAVDGNEQPTVGLLNIGEEAIKGNEQVKQAAALLADSNLNYIGYVEGDGIYQGDADVVVCDGFVGNVMLKTTEGVAKMISHYMKQEFKRNPLTMLSGLIALPVLRALRKRIDPREYNGASFLGLQGIVIKSHGSADAHSFANAISEAVIEVKKNIPELITRQLENQLVTPASHEGTK